MTPAALLVDLDGTLVDSRAPTEEAWREWASEHGLDGEAVAASCHGVPCAEHVAAWAPEVDAEAEGARVEAAMVESDAPTPAFDGARELLAGAPRVAIVTSGSPELADRRLRGAGLRAPAVMVCAGEPERGKPAPDAFLLAAERLGVEPSACVVVEDAPAGVAAARAAGARVLAVAHTHPCDELGDADACFPDLRALLCAL